MADPVYQDQPYMRKSFLFFSDVYLTGAVQSRKCRFRQQTVREHRKTVFAHALLLADVVAYQDGRARTAPIPSSGYSVALFLRAETPGKFHKYNTVKVRKCKGRK